MASRNEYFRRGIRHGGPLMLQLLTTVETEITDIHVLSDGDFAVCGQTKAAAIDGFSTSGYTDGSTYFAYFVAVFDKSLPRSGYCKRIKFYSGASSKRIGGKGVPKILAWTRAGVGDVITLCYGTSANWGSAIATDWLMYTLLASDLSTNHTSASTHNVHYSMSYIAGFDGTYIYHVYFDTGYAQLNIINGSTMTTSTGGTSTNANLPYDAAVGSGEITVFSGAIVSSQLDAMRFVRTVGKTEIDLDSAFDGGYSAVGCVDVGNNVLFSALKAGDTNKYLISLRTKSNESNKPAGWTDYELNVGAALATIRHCYDSETGQILSVYQKVGTGTYDLRLLVLNAATGALVRDVVIVSAVGKTFSPYYSCIVKVSAGKYVLSGRTDGFIPTFDRAGTTWDAFMMVIDETGVVIG